MFRKFKVLALVAALSSASGAAMSQDFVFGWNPRTGDVWVDNTLNDINQYGYRYRDPFVDEMSRYYGAPRDLVSDLLVNRRWAPGDVYYACALAQAVGQPCRRVVDEWDRNHGQGWGVIAQRMGIKPGSPEFQRLKRGFVSSYDRWGRPIRIDESLRADFPNRGKGPKGTAAIDHPGKSGEAKSSEHGKSAYRGNDQAKGEHGPGKANGKSDPGQGKGGKDKDGQGNPGKDKGNGGKGHGKG